MFSLIAPKMKKIRLNGLTNIAFNKPRFDYSFL